MNQRLQTPVVMIVFNRPSLTRTLFERIRAVQPRTLLVIADGPRAERKGEDETCRLTRRICEAVSWPCDLLKNYSDTNLGCGQRPATGIDWVFRNVEEAIILEDDCVPDLSFFPFCEELLARYRNDARVMQISGSNFLFGQRFTESSYYFSRYPDSWGWATWRRAWQRFDFNMAAWQADRRRCLARFDDPRERSFWQTTWDEVSDGRVDIWDSQWSFACFNENGLSATPAVNLVSNFGFGPDATHTSSRLLALRPARGSIKFPLRHPPHPEENIEADRFTARRQFYRRSVLGKAAEVVTRRWLAALSQRRAAKRGREAYAVSVSSGF